MYLPAVTAMKADLARIKETFTTTCLLSQIREMQPFCEAGGAFVPLPRKPTVARRKPPVVHAQRARDDGTINDTQHSDEAHDLLAPDGVDRSFQERMASELAECAKMRTEIETMIKDIEPAMLAIADGSPEQEEGVQGTIVQEPESTNNNSQGRSQRSSAVIAQARVATIAADESSGDEASCMAIDDGPLELSASSSSSSEEEGEDFEDELPLSEPDFTAIQPVSRPGPTGKRKVGKAEAAKIAQKEAKKALAAATAKSYTLKLPQKGSTAEKAYEMAKSARWDHFRASVLLAIGLSPTAEAARDYPADKNTLSYRFTESRGKYTELKDEDDYKQFLSAIEGRAKPKGNASLQVWISYSVRNLAGIIRNAYLAQDAANNTTKKGKGSAKSAATEGEQLVGDPVERKFVAELKAQIGACADPGCKITHCKVTRDGLHTQVTEFMFVNWAKHMAQAAAGVTHASPPITHSCWEPYHPAGTVQVAGNPIQAPLRPGARAGRGDKAADAEKRTDAVMEIVMKQAETTTHTNQMMVTLMQTFADQQASRSSIHPLAPAGHAPAPEAPPAALDYREYPLIETVLITMTSEEKERGIAKPRDYTRYLELFEDSLGWRTVNDMCDGTQTFDTFRRDFAEELKGMQHGPLRTIWERFAFETGRIRNA
ncbi:hypothetical protein AURDEDRAFT_124896 [Auricularia subglabra TFB-10046 SS5]|nr:hypothetical protein AURDEDRAFT_124896 [Auricularia subglabra TFB-10046 SS5]